MTAVRAPGLPANWLNGWLAALGITVLVPGVRLGWTDEALPVALLQTSQESPDLPEAILAALPSTADLDRMAIARDRIARGVGLADYCKAAEIARDANDFSLAASLTDLVALKDGEEVPHSPLDPPAPRGETLWTRLRMCRQLLPEPGAASIRASLSGVGARVGANGLGFDVRRIGMGDRHEPMAVDPVVECLAFFGLAFLPLRGDGHNPRARGWRGRSLVWPAWTQPLDRWALDAVLGQLFRTEPAGWRRLPLGVICAFETVEFERTGSMDPTRGFASRKLA